jgi:hypothetical protein
MFPEKTVLRLSVIAPWHRSEHEIELDELDKAADPLLVYKIIKQLRQQVEDLESGKAYAIDGKIIYRKK